MRAGISANILYFPATRLAGERIRQYIEEYKANDELSADALREKQSAALQFIVTHARRSTEHYRATVVQGTGGASSEFPELDGMPLVRKEMLRDLPHRFVSRDASGRHEKKTTSGSTGHPLTVLKNRDALARERAATWRAYGWAGICVAAPQALLWGVPHSRSGKLRAGLLDFLANRKRLSMFGVTEADLADYHARIVRFRPEYLYGYVSAIAEFARFLEASKRTLPPSVRCIITTSELLDEATRRFLQESTGLRVFNEYGCGEVGSIAHECEHGRLHVMSDNLALECVPVEGLPDGLGELVVTDLHNLAMPLLRYRLGDLGQLSRDQCPCGRPYPVLERIVGRAYDMIIGISGRKYHPESILYVFEDLRKAGIELPAFQAIQAREGELLINFEATSQLVDQTTKALKLRLTLAFGEDLQFLFGRVDQLAREPSGKFRVVKRERP